MSDDETTTLAPRPTGIGGAIMLRGLPDVLMLAETLACAGSMVPKHLARDPAAIAAVILTGIELGMGPMEAMRSIHMIEGKPALDASVMLARAIRAGVRVRWLRSDAKGATIEMVRDGVTHEHSYTIEQARAAGLLGKKNWTAYPAEMLRARCASTGIRAICPDVLGGSYTRDELDASETISATVALVERETDAPAAALPAETRRATLDDCTTAADVLAWCSERADRLSALTGPRRDAAKAGISAAAQRTDADIMGALEAAGLLDAPTDDHAPA